MTQNRRLATMVPLCLLACGTTMAQSKGQQASPPNGAPQNNANATATVPPPELYPLADLPTMRAEVLANLKAAGKVRPRLIWYKTAPGPKEPGSTALPVVLVPLTCKDRPAEWKNNVVSTTGKLSPDARLGEPNFDQKFAEDCDKVAGEPSFNVMMPSLPAQNKGPLKAGQGIVISIFDGDDLLKKYGATLIGLNVQTQTGTYLSPAPLRPSTSGSPSAAQPLANNAAEPSLGLSPPPCGSIRILGGNGQAQRVGENFFIPLKVQVSQLDGKAPANDVTVTFTSSNPGDETKMANSVNGMVGIPLSASLQQGGYHVTASCPGVGNNPRPSAVFNLAAYGTAPFYYLPWWNNPVAGDVIVNVSVTAQAPTPTPLTISTNPIGLSFTVKGQTYSAATTLAFPIGSTVRVTTPRVQGNYKFLRWSDGGRAGPSADDPVIHDVTIGSGALALVAEFAPSDPKEANGPDDSRVAVTLTTNPAGMPVTITSASCVRQNLIWRCSPDKFDVKAAPTQDVGGHLYYFRSWSDGGEIAHSVQVSGEPITLIANYSEASPPPAGSTTPVSITTNAPVPGLVVWINGIEYISPQTLSYPTGVPLNLQVPTLQNLDGNQYTFMSWQDGVANATRTVSASAVSALFPVVFGPPSPVPAPASPLKLSTDPPGLAVTIRDTGAAGAAGLPLTYLPNSTLSTPFGGANANLEVTAVSPQYRNNAMYTFQSWEDPSLTGSVRQVGIQAGTPPRPIKATFSATPIVSAIPVTVATNPPGLWFSVNGIARTSSTVAFLPLGSTAALSTDSPQSLGGIQYTFQGWSDTGTNNTSLTHTFSVPGGSTQNPGNTQTNANAAGQQTQSAAASSASVSAVFAPSAPVYTEQTLTLLSTSYPQTHNPSYFNISSGIVFSTLRNPTWTRQETAPGLTCPTGAPQPCVASPALYQTVQNPNGARTIDPVLFLVIYVKPFDGERKWRPSDLIPAPSLGMSLTSPSTDFFFGVSSEVIRNVQIVAGRHIGKINELSPTGVNDPTSGTAPLTTQHFHPGWFVGATFNISNFIQTLFSGSKGGS